MPRSTQEILAQADDLAKRFENFERSDEGIDAHALRELRHALVRRADAERKNNEAVARAERHSRFAIGAMLGTSGEAAVSDTGGLESLTRPKEGTALTRRRTPRRTSRVFKLDRKL